MVNYKKRVLAPVIMIVLLLFTLPSFVSAASPFKDVKSDHWAYSSIEWAFKKGLIKGYPNGTFAPDKTITEAQFVALLVRFDCSSGDSSDNYRYMQRKNIPLNGYTNSKLRDKVITKGQIARITAAFQGVDLSETYAANYMYMNNLAKGTTGKNDFKDYGANLPMTRADAADFFKRFSKYGKCSMVGLTKKASGSDDKKFELPPNFGGNVTITFPKPENNSKPPVAAGYSDEFDIEKDSLIANGVDSTFVTLSLKSCSGQSISYEDSLSFSVTSKLGAKISGDQTGSNSIFSTDGPDLTVKVTAPTSTSLRKDTISFQINANSNSNVNMNCYQKPITVQLDYVPKAELRVEFNESSTSFNGTLPADGRTTARVTAKIVRPGGQTITNYTGRVRFYSAQGATFSDQYAYFYNGVASTNVSSIRSTQPMIDVITAEIVQSDSRFKDEVATVVNKKHSREIAYDPPLLINNSCSINAEVAFIIDSSGSMQQSDKNRVRVTKTKEFLAVMGSTNSLASRFNSRGYLLSSSQPAYNVRPTIDSVGQSGGTNIADGMDVAFRNFSGSGPKIAILLTDGKSDEKKTLDMLKIAQRDHITIYTIGLGNKKQLNEALLQKLAYETGGQYYHAAENIDIGAAYQSILSEITCAVPAPSCTLASQVFRSPVLESTSSSFSMNTFINEHCGEVARVILRFNSSQGDIDYELIPRGQNFFALTKDNNETLNFDLYSEGVFLAYNGYGYLVGQRHVQMVRK